MVQGNETPGINQGPMWDQDGVHEIYRSWRRVLDEYPGQRMMVAEAWVHPPSRLARYVRPDEMHQTFNFDYLTPRPSASVRASGHGCRNRTASPATPSISRTLCRDRRWSYIVKFCVCVASTDWERGGFAGGSRSRTRWFSTTKVRASRSTLASGMP